MTAEMVTNGKGLDMNSWLLLIVAILFEVSGTTSMKLAEGFTKFWPSLMVFLCYGISFTALTLVLKTIDVSVAYAVWSGLGTAIIALIGIGWFKEPISLLKTVSLAMIIVGVVGLNFSSSH